MICDTFHSQIIATLQSSDTQSNSSGSYDSFQFIKDKELKK